MTDKHLYLIDDGERHWVSARSADEAVSVVARIMGYRPRYYRREFSPRVKRLPDAEPVQVYRDSPYRDPTPSDTKPAGTWAAERDGIVATSVEA